jgi:hypothetical protein
MGTIDEAIKRFQSNAEYERTHGNLQGCLEFRQLAEWLEKLQEIEEIYKKWNEVNDFSYKNAMQMIGKVLKDLPYVKEIIDSV